jgi:glyoxylase-like metal-dependent hydrolase (beta-lactamase superfamily II)
MQLGLAGAKMVVYPQAKIVSSRRLRMDATQIVPGLYVIPVGFVNTFLLEGSDGCTLIDSGMPGSADQLLQAIAKLGKQPQDIRHILLTHAHVDHIGSLAALKKATGAGAYMHALDAPIATSGTGFRPMKAAPGLRMGMMFRMFVRPVASVEAAAIEHTIKDGQQLPIAGGLTAIHVPGHCAGQLAFLWSQHGGVLFASDTCSNRWGLGWSLGYEDFNEGRHSLRRLTTLDFEVACFGHGKAILHDAVRKFRATWA